MSDEIKKPWGSWKTLTSGPGWQVKILTIASGGATSLQLHRERSERWHVLEGLGEARIKDITYHSFDRSSGFMDIPKEAPHRLANRGTEPLVVVEVQFGEYLDEDDLERIEDAYGRPLGRVDPAEDPA